ncbi:hypothetical protein M0804_014817 [Polistes exclamans]|nr:hypothetical protein M0804_014817 [Polistes exclamans]
MVDTGSDVSLVNPRFVDGDSERVRLGARLRYPTGAVFPAVEKVKAKVELGQFSEELFLVVAEISDDCILGRDFLSKAGLVGKFRELISGNEGTVSRIVKGTSEGENEGSIWSSKGRHGFLKEGVQSRRQANYSGGRKPVPGKACCPGGRARLWKRGNVDLKKDSERMLAGASAS